jgi:hypothetical protein
MINRNGDIEAIARTTVRTLLDYCRAENWAGYDPYYALNSRIFKALPFLNFKFARLALTQAVKRSPVNLRPLLLVPKTQNPKGIALFLSSFVKLNRIGLADGDEPICSMAKRLLALRCSDRRYASWGYSFDWQTRSYLVPKEIPNIICSTFAANALLDAYEYSKHSPWLDAAVSTAEFIVDTLFWRKAPSVAFFSYTSIEPAQVHNANLLGAALLCRVSRLSGESRFLSPALDAARYSVDKQHPDGSWDYGESTSQRWIDNFHTGYNLIALSRIREFGNVIDFNSAIRLGVNFYIAHFFRNDGAPKYFHNAVYPVDIHSVAQSIITLIEFKKIRSECTDLANSVLSWTLDNMWDYQGFFYYQRHPYYIVRTPFMRWSQAWMLLALSTFLDRESAT